MANKNINFYIPLLSLKNENIVHSSPLKGGDTPNKNAEVGEETQSGRTIKVQKTTLMLNDVIGDALNRFIQEPPKPVGQVDYRGLSNSINTLLSSKKPKVKREDLLSVSKAVNKLQADQAVINKKTNETLKGRDLLMLARLANKIYLSEEAIELTETQVNFIIKAIDMTNNGLTIMRVCDLLSCDDGLS